MNVLKEYQTSLFYQPGTVKSESYSSVPSQGPSRLVWVKFKEFTAG